MDIRFATIADIPVLLSLVHGAYRGDTARKGWTHEADLLDGQRTDASALEAMLADPDQRILIASDGGAPVGCVAIARMAGGKAYLGMLSVDPERQAGGLGRMLMVEAEAAAVREFGAGRIEMTVIRQRAELIAWYQRRGYALTGETRPFPLDDPRFGLPRTRELAFVVMEKRL